MIEIKLNAPVLDEIPYITVSNEELIKGILAMPDTEYKEVLCGILTVDEPDINRMMVLFAYSGNILKESKLNPAQKNVLESYIKDFKCQT